MKLKGDFVIREFNDTIYAVPLESTDGTRKEPIILNKSARIIWEALGEEKSEEELTELLLSVYDIDAAKAAEDVKSFIGILESAGLMIK